MLIGLPIRELQFAKGGKMSCKGWISDPNWNLPVQGNRSMVPNESVEQVWSFYSSKYCPFIRNNVPYYLSHFGLNIKPHIWI